MPRDLLDVRLSELARRRRMGRALAALVPALAVSLGLCAVAILTIRLAFPQAAAAVPWVAMAGLLAPLAIVLPAALSKRDAPGVLAGHLDLLSRGQGLVMALAEEPSGARDPDWQDRILRRLEGVRLPPIRPPALWPMLLAAISVAIAAGLEQRVEAEPPEVPAWKGLVGETEERLKRLAEAGLLGAEEQDRLEEQLRRLEEAASELGMTQATWESLDRLDRRLDDAKRDATRALAEAIVAAERSLEVDLDKPEEVATPETVPPDEADPERRRRDRDRLKRKDPTQPEGEPGARMRDNAKRLLERLSRPGKDALTQLAKDLGDLAEVAPGLMSRLDPEQLEAMQKLMEALDSELSEAQKQALKEMLKKAMEQAGQQREGQQAEGQQGEGADGGGGPTPLTPEQTKKLIEALKEALDGGAETLGELGQGEALMKLLVALRMLGGGGVARGPGRAPLTREERDPIPLTRTDKLPPGAKVNNDGSVTLHTSTRDPELDDAALRALERAAAQDFEATDADARRARIAPRHRSAVGRYFETGGGRGPDE